MCLSHSTDDLQTFQILCCDLVEDYYGDFYRSIFESLALGGRLNAPQVAQKCHLPLRQARSGLAGLIQLRLVNHHTAKEGPTIYSANLNSAYDLVRAGRLIEAAREGHGESAGKLVSTICQLGFGTISELRDRFVCEDGRAGLASDKEVDELIQTLIDDHFLTMLRRTHFHEPHDAKRDIELNLMSPAALSRLTGTKAKLEHAEAIEARYRQAVDTGFPEHGYTNADFVSRFKAGSTNGVNGVATNGHSTRISTLLQPNYHRVVMMSQTACAHDSVRKTHSQKAATVLSCAVRQVTNPDIWSKHGSNVLFQLDMYKLQQDTTAEFKRESRGDLTNGTSNTNGHRHDVDEDEHQVHVGDLERDLMLLKEGSLRFLSSIGSTWTIDKDALDRWTRQEEILRVMDSRLDPPAPRVLRILIDKGMLEEKTLQEVGLLGAKELRQSLSKLKQMGYLDLQEIPRDPHRLPNKTVFLWNHDAGRVANLVLENVFTSILRLIQMLKLERKNLAGTLEKIERDDVKGKEQEMLAPGEFTVLTRFRRLEGWIWGEIHRLDATVAILRDL